MGLNYDIGTLNGLRANPNYKHNKMPCPTKTKFPYLFRHVLLYRATRRTLKSLQFTTDRQTDRQTGLHEGLTESSKKVNSKRNHL
jgi:hypothetical protein